MSEFAQPRRTQRNDARMTPQSRALLAYIEVNPLSNFDTLYSLFGDDVRSAKAVDRLRSRLAYMVSAGHLVRQNVRGAACWSLGSGTPPVRPPQSAACRMASNTATCSVPVPPPQYDRMRGPAYVPPQDDCPRTGGLDYKRLPSRGNAC